jgi:hypothetical protein
MFGCFLKGERTFTSISKLSPGIDLGQFFPQAPDGTALTLDGQEDLTGTIHSSLNGGGEATYSGKDFCFCQLFPSMHLFPNKWDSKFGSTALWEVIGISPFGRNDMPVCSQTRNDMPVCSQTRNDMLACCNDLSYLMRQALMGYMERGKSHAPNSWQTPRVFRKPLGSYT